MAEDFLESGRMVKLCTILYYIIINNTSDSDLDLSHNFYIYNYIYIFFFFHVNEPVTACMGSH